jgi:hypothetical protein
MDLDDLLQQQLGFNPQRSMAAQKAASAQHRPGSSGGPGPAASSPRALPPSVGASPMRGTGAPASAAASAAASRNASAASLPGLDDPFASLTGIGAKPSPMAQSTGSRYASGEDRNQGDCGGGPGVKALHCQGNAAAQAPFLSQRSQVNRAAHARTARPWCMQLLVRGRGAKRHHMSSMVRCPKD